MTKLKYQTKPTIQTIECYKCPCGKIWRIKDLAVKCCDTKMCTQCDKEPFEYSHRMLCKFCTEKNAQDWWEKSEKKPWGDSPYVYSDTYSEYWDEDTLEYKWEEIFTDKEFDLTEAAQYFRLYICEGVKPRRIEFCESWFDELGLCDDWEPEEGWQEVQEIYDKYIEKCHPFAYIDTAYGLET